MRNKTLLLHDVGWSSCGQPVTALLCQTFILMHFPSLSKGLSHRLLSLSPPHSWCPHGYAVLASPIVVFSTSCGGFLIQSLKHLHALFSNLTEYVLQAPLACAAFCLFFNVETEAQLPLSGGVAVEPSGTLQNKLWQAHGSPDLMSQRLHLWFLLPASPWRPITRCLTELVSGLH